MADIREYKTLDIWLASYLVIKGCMVLRMDRAGSKTVFVFEDEPLVRKYEMEVLNKQDSVSMTTLQSTLKQLKMSTKNDYQREPDKPRPETALKGAFDKAAQEKKS